MRGKKVIALVLATTMVAGSGITVFAADQITGDATGTGTLLPHLDKDVITVTLPTSTAVANVFDYTVDPEQLIKDAAKMKDGTVVTGNEEGVYFKRAGSAAVNGSISSYSIGGVTTGLTIVGFDLGENAVYTYDGTDWKDAEGTAATGTITITKDADSSSVTAANGDTVTVSGAAAAGAASYSSSSDEVEFKGQNSVNVDVTVTAAVEASAGGKDIALVADEDALAAATTPALLMTLKAGTDEKVITTANGATAKAIIAGAPDNFKVDAKADGSGFEYVQKSDADETKWGSAKVQLIGKTNKVSVPSGDGAAMTAPKIKLTWTVAKSTTPSYTQATAHGSWSSGKLWLAKDASTGFSTTGLIVEVSDGGTTYKALSSSQYSINTSGWISTTWNDIVAGIGSTPTKAYVRITDGTTQYVFIN